MLSDDKPVLFLDRVFLKLRSYAMQRERPDLDGDDLATIWRRAQHRRTEDACSWFTNIFKKRRQLKSPDTRPHDDGVLVRSLTLQARTFPLPRTGGSSQNGDQGRAA
jgi:hypothetical protein